MKTCTPQLGNEPSPLMLSRRGVLIGMAAGLTVGATEPLSRSGTPQLTLGPFYPLTRPNDLDADLTRVNGREGMASGTIIEIMGQVTDRSGAPVAGAQMDTWQTNGLGAYHHPADESGKPQDPNFQGAAVFLTDSEGRYRMRTVMPQPYAVRQRHIHFDIRGKNRRLMTQMFFPGEPNAIDSLYSKLDSPELEQAVTAVLAQDDAKGSIPVYRWNVILAGE